MSAPNEEALAGQETFDSSTVAPKNAVKITRVALVLGVMSLLLTIVPVLGIVWAAVALIVSIVALVKAGSRGSSVPMAWTSVVISAVGVVVSIGLSLYVLLSVVPTINDCNDAYSVNDNPSEFNQCVTDKLG